MKRFVTGGDLADITRRIKALGFTYVALDLEGYRTGSLNEPLKGKTGAQK
jgi:uncharacterized protein